MGEELKNTILYKHLESGFLESKDSEIAKKVIGNLTDICKEASERMKVARDIFQEYTLHDEIHLINVTNIMGKIIPEKVIKNLNPIEIFILILSAYFHDQGMVVDNEEYQKIISSDEYKLSEIFSIPLFFN
ncbi:MAG: HD domain-containing protein [Candidatus Helarchaeota archaeon]